MALIFGDGTDETLGGGRNRDFIFGGGGKDRLEGFNGADWLDGGEGDDTLFGGFGGDTLIGGAGNDLLYGYGTGSTYGHPPPYPFFIDASDTFRFDVIGAAKGFEGNDRIADFDPNDRIVIRDVTGTLTTLEALEDVVTVSGTARQFTIAWDDPAAGGTLQVNVNVAPSNPAYQGTVDSLADLVEVYHYTIELA